MRRSKPAGRLVSILSRLSWSGQELVDPEQAVNPAVMARAFAYLYGAGATLVLITLAFPSPDRSVVGIVWPAVVAYGVALAMLIGFERTPLWVFHLLPGMGALLISAVAYSGGGNTFSAYATLYFWVVLSAFYFFGWWRGSPHLLVVAVAYGAVLIADDDASNRALQWVTVVGTLVVASLLLAALRRRIERLFTQLRESDVLKTTLLRSVSHDLKSPLTAIAAAGESSASPSLDEEARREVASVIADEALRLSEMVDKLLDLSRLQGGAATPRRVSCSLEEVLEAALERMPAGRDRVELSLTPGLPGVWADAAQLERVFFNLLENSIRFAGDESVRVSARTVDGAVVVRISDRGPGISTDLEEIFEPFYRGDGTESGHPGSGLGLAIVRGFIEANGGRVSVDSVPGTGTTFVVELPLAPEQP